MTTDDEGRESCPYCLRFECDQPAVCGAELDTPEDAQLPGLGTVLVTTAEAAEAVGVHKSRFRTWATRKGVREVRRVRVGRSWVALYDLDEVYLATRRTPLSEEGSGA